MTAGQGQVHGTVVSVGDRAVLIRGRPGSGKSALALTMLAAGAELVADDQVVLHNVNGVLRASAPKATRGLVEARGVGLIHVPSRNDAAIVLVADLDQSGEARLPHSKLCSYLDVAVQLIPGRNVPHLAPTLMLLLRGGRLNPA